MKEFMFDGNLKIKNVEIAGSKEKLVSRCKSDLTVAGTLYDIEKDVYYLVSSFKKGVMNNITGVFTSVISSDPEESFKELAKEKIGFEVSDLTFVNSFYTMPSISSEKVYLFHADGYKVSESSNDISIIEVTIEDIQDLIEDNEIEDMITDILLNLL